MKKYLIIFGFVVAGVLGCAGPNDIPHIPLLLKDGKQTTVPLAETPSPVQNLSQVLLDKQTNNVNPLPGSKLGIASQAVSSVNYGISLSLRRNESRWFNLYTTSGRMYHFAITPSSGDPDLYVYRNINGTRTRILSSEKGSMRVDRISYRAVANETIYILVYGYSDAGVGFTASWETNNKLVLDVPYLNQNTLAGIGFAACSSTSSVMVLAAHGKIKINELSTKAQEIFAATANTSVGLKSRDLLKSHLESTYGVSMYFDASSWAPLYTLIQSELRAGRPLILGSRSMSGAGHYIVVTGFSGNDYNTAKLIVNDPNGSWRGWNSWSTSSSGQGLEYNFKTITNNSSDGVFVVLP